MILQQHTTIVSQLTVKSDNHNSIYSLRFLQSFAIPVIHCIVGNFLFVKIRTRSTICTCIIFSFPCTLIQCFKIFIFAISCLLLRIVQHLAKNLLASTQMPHVMEYEHIKSNHLLFSEL